MDIETKEDHQTNTNINPSQNPNTDKPLLPVKSDFVFKLIFGEQRNEDILAGFLKSVLELPDDEYDTLTITDPHLKKESENDKYGVLDVKVYTKSERVIHVEIQLLELPEMRERILYYQSRMITKQLVSGTNYSLIKQVVSILITDYTLEKRDDDYRHKIHYRDENGLVFSDLSEIITLELNKLPAMEDSTDLWDWMKFIKSNDKEAMEMLEQRSPALKRAVGVLRELSADEQTRMLYEDREKARRDMVSRMDGALREGEARGIATIARRLLRRRSSVDEIMEITGLSKTEIEEIIQNDPVCQTPQ